MSDEQEIKVVRSVDPSLAHVRPTADKLQQDAIDLAQWINDQWLNEGKTSDVECMVVLSARGSKEAVHAGTFQNPEKQRAVLKEILSGTGTRYDLRRHKKGKS